MCMCVEEEEAERAQAAERADVCELPRPCQNRAFFEPPRLLQTPLFLCQLSRACVPHMHMYTCIDAYAWPGADGVFKNKIK